jgi:hypothetical protein
MLIFQARGHPQYLELAKIFLKDFTESIVLCRHSPHYTGRQCFGGWISPPVTLKFLPFYSFGGLTFCSVMFVTSSPRLSQLVVSVVAKQVKIQHALYAILRNILANEDLCKEDRHYPQLPCAKSLTHNDHRP